MKIKCREDLIEYISHGKRVKYVFFWGHKKSVKGISKSCFSQWYDAPFISGGKCFSTAEHFMMYRKASLFGDSRTAERILLASNPGEAKSLGREVLGFNDVSWQEHRFDIVVKANLAKFDSHPELKEFLLNTGSRILVEASPLDTIWGIGLAADHPDRENPSRWQGQNLLGFALMDVRERLATNPEKPRKNKRVK